MTTVAELIEALQTLDPDWVVEEPRSGGLKLFQPGFRWRTGQRFGYVKTYGSGPDKNQPRILLRTVRTGVGRNQ